MTSYEFEFDFDAMTIGDVLALISDDFELRIMAVHRLTKGGILHLRADELQPVLDDFSIVYKQRIADIASEYQSRTTLRQLLRDAEVSDGN